MLGKFRPKSQHLVTMSKQQFEATLEKSGKQGVMRLPFDPNDVWGDKRQHHITGTVNGIKIRGALKQDETNYLLSIGAAWIRDYPGAIGATFDVILEPEGPQFTDLDDDIAAALNAEPEARAFFEALATFYRTGYLRWLDGAKRRPAVRAERINEFIQLLLAGKKQRK